MILCCLHFLRTPKIPLFTVLTAFNSSLTAAAPRIPSPWHQIGFYGKFKIAVKLEMS